MYLNLVTISFLSTPVLSFGSNSESHDLQIAQGKLQYDVISVDARMPRYGTCWKRALATLETGCKNLDDDIQSRLALNFANCFLEKAGLKTYPCERTETISRCLEGVDMNAFTSFSNFFTHTQNMCYFLQSQVWKEETDKTVERLAENSEKVSRGMEESYKLQSNIMEGQQLTLEYHRQLMENGTYLTQAIQASKDNVKDMLIEFKTNTDEQKNLIFEVFDRVSRLQNLVVSEVNWLYTVVFYAACLLVIYIVTATKRTADARIILFIVLSVNFCLERLVCSYSLPTEHIKVVTELSETVYERIWLVRQISIGVCTLVLSVYGIRYKDYNVINNSLLLDIKKQNLELKREWERFQVGNRSTREFTHDIVDGARAPHYPYLAGLVEDTGFQGDEDEYSDDDSDSFNSTRTDMTFDPSRWSDDEFETAENSRENSGNITPVNQEIDSALEALSGRVLTSVENYPSVLDCSAQSVLPVNQSLLLTPNPKRARTPRSKTSTPTPNRERYNLRSRTPSSGKLNPEVGSETEKEFGLLVRKQLGTSRRNYSKWQLALKKHNNQDFSSDES
jgi:hypothetical protein